MIVCEEIFWLYMICHDKIKILKFCGTFYNFFWRERVVFLVFVLNSFVSIIEHSFDHLVVLKRTVGYIIVRQGGLTITLTTMVLFAPEAKGMSPLARWATVQVSPYFCFGNGQPWRWRFCVFWQLGSRIFHRHLFRRFIIFFGKFCFDPFTNFMPWRGRVECPKCLGPRQTSIFVHG
jgi:hypothetical protein